MDRREFVSTSLIAAGTAVTAPTSLVAQHSTDTELGEFNGFTKKPWDFDGASDYLDSIGDHRFSVLRAALCSTDDATCCLAACMAKRMNQDALPLLAELVALVDDIGSPNWFRAVIVIGQIGTAAEAAGPSLERRLGHPNLQMQLDVVNALSQIQPSRLSELSPFYHVALEQCELAFRACWMVGNLGTGGQRFVPQLESLVFNPPAGIRPDIRCEAARAIYKITRDAALPAVRHGSRVEIQLLNSTDPAIRNIAELRRRSCGPVAPQHDTE